MRELQATFVSRQTNDCQACLQTASTAFYCYNRAEATEWCCSDANPAQCKTNNVTGNVCSPTRGQLGEVAYSYCKGAAGASGCGVNNLELIANSQWKKVSVKNFPAFNMISG